jgi:rhamnulokinase
MTLPSDQRALIAIDLGAESCRVSLLRWLPSGPQIELVHRHPNAPIDLNGELHWDLKQITAQLDLGLKKAVEIATEGVRSIAVDGWAVDYVRLNDKGEALAQPFCYRDERTIASQRELWERISIQRLRAITAVEMNRINTLYQLFADKPAVQDKPWVNLPEYILMRLGGRRVAEYTMATHSQMVDAHTGDWSPEVFTAAGLVQSAAPPIVPPGTVVGQTKSGATLIAPACHDTASAIASIPDSADDWAYISSGTWSLVGTVLDKPLNSEAVQAADFTNLGAAGGRICFHKNVNGMWLLRQCMIAWAKEIDWTIPELIEAAEHLPPSPDVLIVDEPDLLLPGNMPTRINRQLQQRGLRTYDPAAASAPQMVNLIMHSLAARYREVIGSVAYLTGKKLRKVYIVGGGSRNALLNRLTAQATGLEVRTGAVESSTVGNFAVQLATLENKVADKAAVAYWAQQLSNALL